ncbi:MAG: M23 family metallopeptidase [Acidobacteria bacterium]|nr:M23 family metallopeptidase [Acidobacteriota bacterium]
MLAVLLAVPSTGMARQQSIDITVRARSLQPGELVVVGLTLDRDATMVEVTAFDRSSPAYRVGPGRWEALVGIDLDQAAGEYVLRASADGGAATGQRVLAVAAKSFAVRTLKVNPDFVNPPKAVLARIQEESRFLQAIYEAPAPRRLWEGPFHRPVPHRANSRFGVRSVFNGERRNPHAGTDFLSPAGTPILAPNAGRVVAARDLYFSGRTVILDHGLGLFSQLAHMSRIDVAEGDVVTAGQVVGLVGATGRVTGAHLHWGLRAGTARVDALSLLALLAKDPP